MCVCVDTHRDGGEKCTAAGRKMRSVIQTHGTHQIKQYQLGPNLKIDCIRSVFREAVLWGRRATDPYKRTDTLKRAHRSSNYNTL